MNIITSGIDIELSYAETLDLIELLAYTKQKARNKALSAVHKEMNCAIHI